MEFVLELLRDTFLYVLGTLAHNLPVLALGVMVAAAMQVYMDPDRMRNWLLRRSSASIPATVIFGAFTPFCACGTMAIVISMLATALPWGPVMAFLTSSPLMSPEGFILVSGIISPSFAVALAVASVLIGLGAGYATHLIEKKTRFLHNQLRFSPSEAPSDTSGCGCSSAEDAMGKAVLAHTSCCSEESERGCGCGDAEPAAAANGCGCAALAMEPPMRARPAGSFLKKHKIDKLLKAAFDVGVRKILPYFAMFAAIGYLVNRIIPSAWITALFGAQNMFAVPLASAIGLPLYVSGDSSIPLIQQLLHSGVGKGAMLAFLITGPGTSAGVMAGIATILKKKAIALYVGYLLVGAMLLGYAYDLILALVG